jgi:hypothetical protein
VDCQYEYFFVSDFNHYGFISYHAGECTHQVAEKGIVTRRPEYKEAGYQEIRKIEQIKKVFN